MTSPEYYDDNFGHWDIQSEEDIEFYHQVQRNSVWKTCEKCGKRVKIQKHYAICDACATAAENGWEY